MNNEKKVRQSNLELLRVVAMLMVVVLHSTFTTFGYARANMVQAHPARWLGIITAASVCMGCVNLFVLITGWFGTSFRPRGIVRILLQVLFVSVVMTAFAYAMGYKMPTESMGYFRPLWGYWFVNSYLLLYLLTPVLNAFVNQSDELTLRRFLIAFYVCVIPASYIFSDLNVGYAAVPFMGLYLLGRYLRLYLAPRLQQVAKWKFLTLWTACVLAMALLLWGAGMLAQPCIGLLMPVFASYTNPILILSAVALLLFFTRLKFQSAVVKWLAAGSFTVYLTHQHLLVRKEYFTFVRQLDKDTSSTLLFMGEMLLVYLTIYLLSALIDWGRRLLFKRWA